MIVFGTTISLAIVIVTILVAYVIVQVWLALGHHR